MRNVGIDKKNCERAKIYHACKLLKRGHSLQAVCEDCGFENMSYFIQLFKKIVGITPKQYMLESEIR